MRHFRRWSIRLKLTLMLLVPLLLLLALSNGAFIYAEFSSFEERTRSKLAPLAVVLGTQATAALSFNEPKSTESDLASLSAESGIVAAFVFDAEGDIFAGYPAPLLPTGVMLRRMEYGKKLLSNESDGGLLMRYGDEAHFVQPILLHDEHLGTIQLVLNLQELHADFYDQLRLRGAIILIALLLAVLFSVSLPRLISEPIRQLRRLMTEVCRQQDYRRLGHKVANDEIGDLVDGFNEVLREVETRDQALLEHSLKLEQQVAERTMELTQAKEAAEDADRAKGEFLANMNHEIRTPLNTVLGYVSLLEEKELDAEGRDYLRTIQTAGTSLLQLVQDILDLSRLESGRDQLQPGPVELKRLMVDTKRMLVHRTEKKGVEFVVEYADELPRIVLLDETRILQILINLASNAAKFTDQGQIRIEATGHALGPTEWRLELNVEDTGIGIPKGQHEEVFKAFTQSRGQRLAEYGGTGLGLAICSRLAESMGGEIRLRSSEGAGSCFSLILPSVQVAEGQSPGTEPLQGREFLAARVLVADDNPSNLQLLVQLLVNMGFEVQQAVDGLQLLLRVEQEQPDLILTDIDMPKLTGDAAARALRESPEIREIPVVAVTALTGDALSGDLSEVFDAILSKPYTKEQLIGVLSRFLPLKPGSHTDPGESEVAQEVAETAVTAPLPELLATQWSELGSSSSINEVEAFGFALCRYAEEAGDSVLHSWGERLIQAAGTFDPQAVDYVLERMARNIPSSES